MLNRVVYILLAVTLVPLGYVNCSKSAPAPGLGASPGNGGNLGSSDALTNFTVKSDGSIVVNQDKRLHYSPTGGTVGSYAINSLPTWATFDASTGTIDGIPHNLTDTGSFSITDVGRFKVYGPFNVSVIGDPLKGQEWYLLNTGQNAYALTGGTPGEDIHYTSSVADNLLGVGIRVAISDTGAVISHPDLSANVLSNESRNYLNNYAVTNTWLGDPTPSTADGENGHGTAVAGLLAAKGWNGIGGRGVASEARFAAFLFLQAQDQLSSAGLLTSALYDQYTGNFDIFNFSWGDSQCMLTQYPQSYRDKLAYGVAYQRGNKGSLFMLANGNWFVEDVNDCYSSVTAGTDFVLGNGNFTELNTTPFTLNISAVNADGVAASYSTPGSTIWVASTGGEYGWSQTQSGSPEVSKPALVTTDYPGCNNGIKSLDKANSTFDAGGTPNTDCLYTNTMNGTSGATPIASGAVAMLLQANPNLSWRDVKYILAKTADKVDPTVNPVNHPVSSSNLAGHAYEQGWITNAAGFNYQNWYGFGRINVDNAVQLAKNYTYPLGAFKNTAWKHDSGAISVQIPDHDATGISRTLSVTDALTIEAVQVRVSTSACASDLGIELTSPRGTKSILMNINSRLRDGAISDHTFLSNAFYGEPSAGTWTLKVLDGTTGCVANLTNWKLNFYGY